MKTQKTITENIQSKPVLYGLIAVLFLTSTYLLLSRNTLTPAPSSTMYPTPTITTSSETADWKTYTLKSVGLTYKLPPEAVALGELQEFVVPGQKGTQVFVSRENSKIISDKEMVMGTTSIDYDAGRGGMFIDLQGFTKENGKYYARFVQGKTFDLSSETTTEILNPNGLEILKIKGSNFEEETEGLPVAGTPGKGKIGALININRPPYQGFAVQMDLKTNLTEQLFDQILSTFKFTD